MSTVINNTSIPKNTATNDDLDFEFLRKKGIEYIESLGSSLWTDYNSHDPGKTFLEVLCYALTDLGARIDLPMPTLLADKDNSAYLKEQFLTADKALPIKPITPEDYRKLFIDLDGIKNAWIRKHEKTIYADCKNHKLTYAPAGIDPNFKKEFILNGLYDVLIEIDPLDPEEFNTKPKIAQKIKDLKAAIRTAYHAHRNLCEDLINIDIVEEHPVKICAQVELHPEADEDLVHALILQIIDQYLSPNLRFYSLKEMLSKGYSTDAIYNGPLLDNGFIDSAELSETELKKEIRLSDLIDLIQKIDGVDVIRDITIDNCDGESDGLKLWNICVPEGKKPSRCDKSAFSYYKGFLPLNINQDAVEAYQESFATESDNELAQIAAESKELELPFGEDTEVGNYTTIQNDLPELYGVGTRGFRPTAPIEHKAKVKQLKAYLLFFDQILASYFAHLQKVKELFSINGNSSKSYFSQGVNELKDISEIVSANYTTDENITDLLLSDLDDTVARRNDILDHLLSRFSESFSEYAFLMKQLYGSNTDQAVIQTKERFLKEYGMIGCERGLSFNYFEQAPENLWDTSNVSALQKRIALLSGNPNYDRRNFSDGPLEIYEEVDGDGIIEYRFRFRNAAKTILSSGSKHYHSLASLYKEILDIKNYGRFVENYEIKVNVSGRFYFNLTNPNFPDVNDERHVIARRIPSFLTQANAEAAIAQAADFISLLDPNEGMYIVEHILLRPDVTRKTMPAEAFMPICEDNCSGCEGIDPYSFRVSIVLPGWTERYSNVDFRKFMEDVIRQELPSHIVAKICWIGWPQSYDTNGEENEMVEMEEAYQEWLLSKTNNGQKQDIPKLERLNLIVNTLHTIYTQGRLHNCDRDEEQQDVILGRTNLGRI